MIAAKPTAGSSQHHSRRPASVKVARPTSSEARQISAATVRAGEQCLATGALTGSLRRLLADQLEDLRRSVAVRSLEDPSSYRG